jgi:hypothetical protein
LFSSLTNASALKSLAQTLSKDKKKWKIIT